MKHTRKWFKNRMKETVYCNDHAGGQCDGILIESATVADNLFKSQDNGVHFFERQP